jgi:hypothetical protein
MSAASPEHEPVPVPVPPAQPVAVSPAPGGPEAAPPRKGPLSFLSGAVTSGLLAWFCLWLSRRVVAYYTLHPPHYEARVAQSIATALKTLIVGMSFLATFSFAFVGLGLALVFVRSLSQPRPEPPA